MKSAHPPLRIDSHQHLWRYSEAEYGWIDDSMADLRHDFLLADLRRVMAEAHVDATVAVQARQSIEETRFLLDLALEADSPVAGVVGWLPLAEDHFPELLHAFAPERKLRGLRHVVQGEAAGFLDGADFNRGIAALRDTGLVYDVLIYARQLEEATHFVDRHPGQLFVLDHIAKPDLRHGGFREWEAGFRALAKRPHVTCKLSGMVTETDWTCWTAAELKPCFEVALESFGPERLMIGSDWPVLTVGCDYARWWQTVEQWIAPLSRDEQAHILGGTAARVYRLEGTTGVQD